MQGGGGLGLDGHHADRVVLGLALALAKQFAHGLQRLELALLPIRL